MGYKWKPSRAQKEEYKAKMAIKEALPIVQSAGAIRCGCKLEWFNVSPGEVLKGTVTRSTYGEDGQHTFTVTIEGGESVCVKGRNLYPNLLNHIQGEESLNVSRI